MSSSSSSSRALLAGAFLLGLLAIGWVGVGFVGTHSWLALGMTLAIAAAYLVGALEVRRFRSASAGLAQALASIPQPLAHLADWLARVPAPLHNAVRQRVESGRGALPGLALTPYLIGLLVMLGMLGTFLGMVVTFKGAVFALEGSADLGAIRGALAAPIKGLGISFGTSVAGVAASAMLGLMSAIARRERTDVARALEQHIGAALRPFTAAFIAAENRDRSFAALQRQADALPQVVTQLQALMEQVEQRHRQLDEQLSERQDRFHREAAAAYTGLGQSVAQALNHSLVTSARVAGESIQPVVEHAMAALAQESARQHERVSAAVQAQLTGLSTQFAATTGSVAEGWNAALQQHERSSEQLIGGLGQALAQFNASFDARATQLLANVQQATAQQHGEQAQAEALRQAAWTTALHGMASGLQAEWQQVGAANLAQQQAVCQTLEHTASALQHSASEQAARSMDGMARLLETASEAPKAAAEVIGQLRGEMSRLTERDNLALQERSELVAHISSLLQNVQQTTGEQRAAIESLVASATTVLNQTGAQFAQTLGAQAGRADEQSALLASSATELAALGQAFQQGVQLFSSTNEQLVDGLQRVEGAIGQHMARSDEQLAYYVAQAREVIDLSISAQQGIVEDLRSLRTAKPAAAKAAVPALGAAT